MKRIALLFVLLFSLSYLLGCSSTTGIDSGPFSYDESRAEQIDADTGRLEDVPRIRSYNTILLREKAVDGAIKSFALKLGNALNGITPAGVVAGLGTSPERAFSELESGSRAQFTWSHTIDNPENQNIDYSIKMDGIDNQSGQNGKTAVAESVTIKVSSEQASE